MKIQELSKILKLSGHTLRYYEKIGILKPVSKDQSGHRNYSDEDIQRLSFIIRLKKTGMRLKQILDYVQLIDKGEKTIPERYKILISHNKSLETRINELIEHKQKLNEKINIYKNFLKNS